jgi:hypothetical protein
MLPIGLMGHWKAARHALTKPRSKLVSKISLQPEDLRKLI